MRAMQDYVDSFGHVRLPSSRRLNPPCLLEGLSDDVILRVFSRVPFSMHGSLHVVCRRVHAPRSAGEPVKVPVTGSEIPISLRHHSF